MIATNSVLSAASAPSARSSVQTRAQAAAKGFQARSAGSLSGRSLSVAGAAAPCVLRAAESRKSSVRVRAAAEGSELEALGAVKVGAKMSRAKLIARLHTILPCQALGSSSSGSLDSSWFDDAKTRWATPVSVSPASRAGPHHRPRPRAGNLR